MGDHHSTLSVGFQIVQKERRIIQLKGLLKGTYSSIDARIKKKIHKLRKELCILDPSRKLPEPWTLISVMKFVGRLKSKVAGSRSYLCRIMCCGSHAGRGATDCDFDAQTTVIDLDDDPAAQTSVIDLDDDPAALTSVIDLDGVVDLDDVPAI